MTESCSPAEVKCTQCSRTADPPFKLCEQCRYSRKVSRVIRIERRMSQGKCQLCERKATRGNHCAEHHAIRLEDQRIRRNQKPRKGNYCCANCGEQGHNIATCPNEEVWKATK